MNTLTDTRHSRNPLIGQYKPRNPDIIMIVSTGEAIERLQPVFDHRRIYVCTLDQLGSTKADTIIVFESAFHLNPPMPRDAFMDRLSKLRQNLVDPANGSLIRL